MRVLIVDDEAPARAKLRRLLQAASDVEIVGEADDGVEAVLALRRLSPDLVFLDVQMPRLDGFGVLAEIGVERMPLVVFVTAYDEHAVRAFEVQALDYLLKPFAPRRLEQVLDRVRRRTQADLAPRLRETLAAAAPRLRWLLVSKGEDREALLDVETIDLVRADGNYVRIHAGGATYTRRATLSSLADRLDPDRFVRLNRSEVVRLEAVAELQPWFHGDCRVKLKNGTTLTWSRRYRGKIKDSM